MLKRDGMGLRRKRLPNDLSLPYRPIEKRSLR